MDSVLKLLETEKDHVSAEVRTLIERARDAYNGIGELSGESAQPIAEYAEAFGNTKIAINKARQELALFKKTESERNKDSKHAQVQEQFNWKKDTALSGLDVLE